jgi:murein DD-endopeptidase MepM/ murein hydrolase activator NlpD
MKRAIALAAALAVASPLLATGPGGGRPPPDPALALAALDRKIADLDAEEQGDKGELARLGGPIALAHARVLARTRAYYKLTRAGLMPAGGGFAALVTHAMHVERARRRLVSDVAEEASLRKRAGDLAGELERVARDRETLASQRTAMDAARMAMDDERRRQEAFDKAFETSTGAGPEYVAVYGGAAGAAPGAAPQGFGGASGRLLFPVVGRAEAHPARRDGTDGPGLEIQASAGAVVRAVAAGRVAFADRYGPYGRIVILDHGDHYYTVSGNLDAIEVKIGQDVGPGDRIGTVGDDGQGPMLYFEIRHGSQAIPPAPWLGL